MPSYGFNIRFSASDEAAVRKALEGLGKDGESALKKIDRAAKSTSSGGLKAVNAGLRDVQIQGQLAVQRLGPLGSVLSTLGPAGLAAGAAIVGLTAGLGALGGAVISNAREFESLRARLKTVTGSADLASAAFERIKEFAASTPFEVQNLVTAFTRLAAAGIEPTTERLRSFGDTAAAFGKDITEFADAVVGALTGEGERLKQFGIITRFEGDKVRFTFRGLTKEVSRDAAEIVSALEDIGNTAFAGGMEEQARTLEGVTSNLADAWSSLLDRFDETTGAADKAKSALRAVTEFLQIQERSLELLDSSSGESLRVRRADVVGDLNALADAAAARQAEIQNLSPVGRALGFGQRLVEEDLAALQEEEKAAKALRAELAQINAELDKQARLQAQTAMLEGEQARLAAEASARAKEEAEAAEAEEEAAKEAAKAATKLAAERERALARIQRLEEETARAGLEGVELLEVRRDQELAEYDARLAKKLGLEEEFAAARLKVEERFQKEKAEIEAEAEERAEEERRRAREKADKDAARAREKVEEEARREAERQAEILQRPFINASDNIQDSLTDAIDSGLRGGFDDLDDYLDAAKGIFTRWVAEVGALMVFRPTITGGLTLGGAGLGAGSGASAGLGSFGGLNLGGLGSLLSFGGGAGPVSGVADGAAAQNLIAASSGFDFGGFLGGAGLGFGAGSLLNSLIGGNAVGGSIGSGVGSAAGAAIGSFIPGVGTLLGGLIGGGLGGLFGGLFGPGTSVGPNTVGRVGSSGGRLTVGKIKADNGGDIAGTRDFAEAVAAQVNALLDQLEADIDSVFRVGTFGGDFRVGRNYNFGRLDRNLGSDPQDALTGATLYAFETSQLTGIDGALADAVKRAAKVSEDLEDFAANVAVAQAILDDSIFDEQELTSAEQALKDLAEQFEEAEERAVKLGLSTAKLSELYDKAVTDLTEGFDEGIRLQILSITDPLAAALEQQAKTAEERLREAEALGGDLVEVERLNALERQRIIEQQGGDLKKFFEEITFGGLSGVSPAAGLEAQRAAFEAAAASGDVSNLASLGRGLLQSAQGVYASGPEYQAILSRVQNVVGGYVSANDNPVASAVNTGFAESVTVQQRMLNELAEMRTEIAKLRNDNARLNSILEGRLIA